MASLAKLSADTDKSYEPNLWQGLLGLRQSLLDRGHAQNLFARQPWCLFHRVQQCWGSVHDVYYLYIHIYLFHSGQNFHQTAVQSGRLRRVVGRPVGRPEGRPVCLSACILQGERAISSSFAESFAAPTYCKRERERERERANKRVQESLFFARLLCGRSRPCLQLAVINFSVYSECEHVESTRNVRIKKAKAVSVWKACLVLWAKDNSSRGDGSILGYTHTPKSRCLRVCSSLLWRANQWLSSPQGRVEGQKIRGGEVRKKWGTFIGFSPMRDCCTTCF